MGGPNHPGEVSVFLLNMFKDKNIIPLRPLLRSLIAHCITAARIKHAAYTYSLIGGKSPIAEHTSHLVRSLRAQEPRYYFDFAMSYTPPFILDSIQSMQEAGVSELFLFSLYPQYSTTTTLTSFEKVQEACAKLGYYPRISLLDRYYDDPLYNDAVIDRIHEAMTEHGLDYAQTHLIFSAHALPESITRKGDPYVSEIEHNAAILSRRLEAGGRRFKTVRHAFQSKLGPVRWSSPSIAEVLDQMRGEAVLIYPLAFTIDNSETDYELSIQYREYAAEKGITRYAVSRCLNDSPLFVQAILNLLSARGFDR